MRRRLHGITATQSVDGRARGPARMTDRRPLRARRLNSEAAVAHALRGLDADAGVGTADRGLVVGSEPDLMLALGLMRSHPRLALGLGRAAVLTGTPIIVAADAAADAVREAASAALRELVLGEPEWHVLRLVDAPPAVVDAAWPLATALGYTCTVTQHPAPARTADGGAAAGPMLLSIYSPRLKGRWLRATDARVGAMLGAAARERVAVLFRRGGAAAPAVEEGSRFFALDLAAVPAAPGWGPEVSFREVGPREAEAEPLRYCTTVRRLHEALRRGDRCFATYVDGALAHTHWVSTDDAFLRRMVPARALDGRIAHPFDSYTFPAYRGRRLQGATHHWLALRYREEGIERFVVRITASNAASIRGVQKVGYGELSAG